MVRGCLKWTGLAGRVPVPWTAQDCLKAATIHIGGTFEEIAGAEDEVLGKGSIPIFRLYCWCSPVCFDETRAPKGKTDGVGLLPCAERFDI